MTPSHKVTISKGDTKKSYYFTTEPSEINKEDCINSFKKEFKTSGTVEVVVSECKLRPITKN